MAENQLTKLPLAGQLGVSLLAAALIGGAFYYLWYSDALAQEQTKTTRLQQLETEIKALEVTANKLQEFQREVQLLEAKLETLKRILPPEKETPDLMRRVQYLATQSSLSIKVFTPAAVANKGGPPEYVEKNWDKLVGAAQSLAELALEQQKK